MVNPRCGDLNNKLLQRMTNIHDDDEDGEEDEEDGTITWLRVNI